MPDTHYVECFQSDHQNRRLSEKLYDISKKETEGKHTKQGHIKNIDAIENRTDSLKEESSNTVKYIYKWRALGFMGCLNVEEEEELDDEEVLPVYAIGDSNKTIK